MRLLPACAVAGALLSGCDTTPGYDADLTSPSVWVLASGAEAKGAEVTFGTDRQFSARLVCNGVFGTYSASYGRITVDGRGDDARGVRGRGTRQRPRSSRHWRRPSDS